MEQEKSYRLMSTSEMLDIPRVFSHAFSGRGGARLPWGRIIYKKGDLGGGNFCRLSITLRTSNIRHALRLYAL